MMKLQGPPKIRDGRPYLSTPPWYASEKRQLNHASIIMITKELTDTQCYVNFNTKISDQLKELIQYYNVVLGFFPKSIGSIWGEKEKFSLVTE